MKRQVVERALLLLATTTQLVVSSAERGVAWNQPLEWVLGAAVLVLLVLHSRRREMATLYVALAVRLASFLPLVTTAGSPSSWGMAAAMDVTVWIGVVMAWSASLLFPWPDFSRLHGAYQTIGCRTARYGGVECRVFYPSAKDPPRKEKLKSTPYAHHGHHLMTGMSVFTKMPAWLFHNMANAHLAAQDNVPVASPPESTADWPVVIFSHGLAGSLEVYSYLNQQFASHGNVVVVPNHCDGSACVCSPAPGRIDYYQQIPPEVRDDTDGAGFRFRNRQLQQRVDEVLSVVDAITQDNDVGSVFERSNLGDVSLVGHSFGAATVLSVAHKDERIQRAVLLDAWMEPLDDIVRDGLGPRVPVLHLMSEHFFNWQENAKSTERHARGCTHKQSRLKWLRGMRHNNFSDMPVFSPTLNKLMKSAGKIDHFYALETVGELSAAFLAGSFDTRATDFLEVLAVGDVK